MELKSGDVRQKSLAEAEEHIKRYRSSGMTQKLYCDQEGINKATFAYWLKRHRENEGMSQGFVRVAVPQKESELEIVFANGVVMRFNTIVEVKYIKELIG